jgi:ubiquinone/menaquinone biosynthesis C-methylase UbiE
MLSNLLIQLVEIKLGKRVLDIATGIGDIYIKENKKMT